LNLLLDSNLLLLLAVGSYDLELIRSFKRVSDYTVKEYEIPKRFAPGFREVISTPHILTEVSNLANSLPAYIRPAWLAHFSQSVGGMEERHLPAVELMEAPEFAIFGLTDAALSRLSETVLLATADERLCSYLQRRNLFAISFNEIRAEQSPRF